MKALKKLSLALGLIMALAGLPVVVAAFAMSQPARSPQDQQQPPDQPDKKKDKKKKKDDSPGAEDSPDNAAGARRAIKRVLGDFQDGFEGHSPRRVTDSLDDRFVDFARFQAAVPRFLERTSEIRL